jgi:hypothetical protein
MIKPEDIEIKSAALKATLKDFESRIGMPSDDVIWGIVRKYKLNQLQAAALKDTVRRIVGWKSTIEEYEKLGSYSSVSKSFGRIERYFRHLRREVSRNIDRIDCILASEIRASLAPVVEVPSEHYSEGEGGAGRIYLFLIDALYSPIKTQLDLYKSNKGGRPPKRDLVREMLARNKEAIIGKRAERGKFGGVCDSVREAVGFSDEALGEGVEKKLKGRKSTPLRRGVRK